MKTHNIKLNIAFCDDVYSGIKPFEIRENDRGYQKGDHIKFIPYDSKIYPLTPKHPIANKVPVITTTIVVLIPVSGFSIPHAASYAALLTILPLLS